MHFWTPEHNSWLVKYGWDLVNGWVGGGVRGGGALKAKHLGSDEKLSPGENTVLHPGKTRLKPRLFLPAILAEN